MNALNQNSIKTLSQAAADLDFLASLRKLLGRKSVQVL